MALSSVRNKFKAKLLAGVMSVTLIAIPSLSSAVPAVPSQSVNVQDAAKKLGLTKPSTKSFNYSKKSSTKDSFVIENLKTDDGLVAKKLVLDKQEETGKVRITLYDGSTPGDTELKFAKLIIVFDELGGDKNISNFINIAHGSDDGFKGDISLENAEIEGNGVPVTFAKLAINGMTTKGAETKFKEILIRDLKSNLSVAVLKISEFNISGLNDAFFNIVAAKDKKESADKNWSDVGWDKLQIKGVEITPTEAALKASQDLENSFEGFSLANFEINGLGKNILKNFVIQGLKAKFKFDNSEAIGNIGEFSFENLNMQYFRSIFEYSLPAEDGKPPKDYTLAEIMPYGPLGGVVTGAVYNDVNFTGGGVKFAIDDMKAIPTFNAQNIVTSLISTKSNIDLSVTDNTGKSGKILADSFEKFGLKSLHISFAGRNDFDPVTDITSSSDTYIEAKDVGKIDYDMKIGGVQKVLSQIKISDVANVSKDVQKDIDNPDKNSDALFNSIKLYQDVEIIGGRFTLRDYGFINRAIIAEAASKGKKPKQVKDEWLKNFKDVAKDKSAGPTKKAFSESAVKFIENGGAIEVKFAPAAPVKLSQFNNKNVKPNELGLTFNNIK